MKLSLGTLKMIVDDLKTKIINNYISNVSIIGNHDFLFSFSKYREKRLFVSLSHQSPFLCLVSNNMSFPTTLGRLNDNIRKEIKDSLITDISILAEDRIVAFQITKTNDLYEKISKTLIFELIPTKPNLLVVDDKGKNIFVLHEMSLEKSRPLMRGISYEPPLKKGEFKTLINDESISDYESMAEDKLKESRHKQIKDRFAILFHHLKSRSKSLAKKEIVLNSEMKDAEKDLCFLEHGNMLLALSDNIESINLYVKANNLSYDSKLSVGINANHYFKKYKKAKRTIQMNHSEIIKAQEEMARLEALIGQSQYMNENELYELALSEMPHEFSSSNHKKTKDKASIAYVIYDNSKIYFGKNDKQNECITFKLAHPSDWFFHIKDYPGSHVVIANENPSESQILLAGEMCLVLSNKITAEVQYAQIKDVKKTSKVGQVILQKQHLLIIKNVQEETLKLLDNSYRMVI